MMHNNIPVLCKSFTLFGIEIMLLYRQLKEKDMNILCTNLCTIVQPILKGLNIMI